MCLCTWILFTSSPFHYRHTNTVFSSVCKNVGRGKLQKSRQRLGILHRGMLAKGIEICSVWFNILVLCRSLSGGCNVWHVLAIICLLFCSPSKDSPFSGTFYWELILYFSAGETWKNNKTEFPLSLSKQL